MAAGGWSKSVRYSNKAVDHFRNPRNVGTLPKDDPHVGTGTAGRPERADVSRVQVRIDPVTGRVAESRFKAFGCTAAIASGSLVAEWAAGRTLDEAGAIAPEDIVRELDLPGSRRHCAEAAAEALRDAIADARRKDAKRQGRAG